MLDDRPQPVLDDVSRRADPDAALGRLMLAFQGTRVPGWLRARLAAAPAAGVTLFRGPNVRGPAQVRRLTAELQAASGGGQAGVLLVAADQEGGQLLALGDGFTPFAGPMAIGAAADEGLAERVGRAIGLELRAVGVNVNYAPALDVASNPANPSLGIRSFGDDPEAVARFGTAWLRGLQSAGIAGTLKHFPGKGSSGVDTHHELAIIERTRAELDAVELAPFRAAIRDGARVVMSGHFALPALTGTRTLPSTLAGEVMDRLLRRDLGFTGVSITDALDMRALPQDARQAVDVVAALRAGVDLLLMTPDRDSQRRIESAVRRAVELGLVEPAAMAASARRIEALRRWLAGHDTPALDVVGGAEHRALATELARRALTLVRDDGTLPLRLPPVARLAAIMPRPTDLTPADTSSYVAPGLAAALREHHPTVDEVITAHPPTEAEVAGLRRRAAAGDWAAVVLGTISAAPGSAQAGLAEALRAALAPLGRPLVTVALRTPWDLEAYARVGVNVATYSILPESMSALAAALFARADGDAFPGRLPVRLSVEGR